MKNESDEPVLLKLDSLHTLWKEVVALRTPLYREERAWDSDFACTDLSDARRTCEALYDYINVFLKRQDDWRCRFEAKTNKVERPEAPAWGGVRVVDTHGDSQGGPWTVQEFGKRERR